jgi:succinyl-diaminopimelate desuccinylase
VLTRDEVAREPRGFGTREPRANVDSLGRVATLGDRRTEVVERREGLPVGVRDEQPDVLEAIGEEIGDPRFESTEPLAGIGRHEERSWICMLYPPPGQRVERIDLVQHELDRDVVSSDLGQDGTHCGDGLGQPLLGEGGIRDVEDEIGDECLLERGGEALHELRRQPADESDRVRHEVALPVVLERTRRRVERLEEAIVDRGVCSGERVQERRLPDVRIPSERDRRNTRAPTLLPASRALTRKPTKTLLQQRDPRPCETAVRLELAFARAAGPDATTEALEVVPHPAHPRKVVLELRELDLELPLRAPSVLREDVEDQLGAVDNPRLQCIFERSLLCRAELVVDEEHLASGVSEGLLELRQLSLADERSYIRPCAMLDELPARRDTGGASQLFQLSELDLAVGALGIDADEKSALRLRPRCGIGLARSHRRIMPLYAPAVTALADRLAARTLELVDIPSESGSEAAIRQHVLGLVPAGWTPEYAGDEAFFFMSPRRAGYPLVVFVAHYDTIPAQGNIPGRIVDGAVHGLGASDMKGGLAVAIELARDVDLESATCDLALLLFGREELPAEHNPLPALLDASTGVHETTLAVVLEPTDLEIQSGCLGNVVARLTFHGTSGHSARPWLADSALERAVRGLGPLFELEPRLAVVGDLEFREVLSVTRLQAGIADNVIPGEATATVNLRYPPDRTPAEAETFLATLVPDSATLEVVSNAAPGRVVADSPAVRALQAAGAPAIQAKQAWTNVADFTQRNLDAVNFGPGNTALAHHRDEHVSIASLATAYEVLTRFVASPIGEDAA